MDSQRKTAAAATDYILLSQTLTRQKGLIAAKVINDKRGTLFYFSTFFSHPYVRTMKEREREL